MLSVVGIVVGLIVVLALAAAVLAVLHFRFGLFRQRKARGGTQSGILGHSRVEVLESTPVDDERRLVLLRCDRIEHLVMVGGPADLVVENDVKKVRGPGAPADAIVPETGKLAAAPILGAAAAKEAPAAPMPSVTPPATATPRPEAPPAPAARTREKRQRSGGAQFQRREPAAAQRTIQPTPLGGARAESGQDGQSAAGRRNGGGQQRNGGGLPNAGVPWAEPDTIENEIVQALRVDPVQSDGGTKPQPPLSAKRSNDSSTTLGDLADRLEEALAEEVQSANQGRTEPKQKASSDDAADTAPSASARQRSDGGDKGRARAIEPRSLGGESSGAAPESERRRESSAPSERREEAPVISLDSRRRETGDALEDEMARLLGELTGDTKGR